MPSLEHDRLKVSAAREDHEWPVGSLHRESEIGKQKDKGAHKDGNAEQALGCQALEENRLKLDFPEPEPLGVHLGERGHADQEQ